MKVKIKVVLDKRVEYKDGQYNLSIRLNHKKETVYLPMVKLTEKQYETVFVKNHLGKNSNDLREKVNQTLSRVENICADMVEFNGKRFKKLFNDPEYPSKTSNTEYPKTLELKKLFDYYVENNKSLKANTKQHYNSTLSVLEKYDPGVSVYDITPQFLVKFEREKLKGGKCNLQGLGSYLRDLRRIINYFTKVVKIIPKEYDYPFTEGGYSIKNVRRKKRVLSEDEIRSIMELEEFESPYQEYARDIWLTLYYSNGINFVDLMRMRWDNIHENHIRIFRKKTETTQKKVRLEIVIPLTQPLKDLINKVGDPNSNFLIGQIKENYTDQSITNRKNKVRGYINPELRKIGKKLNLSVPLTTQTARDCYSNTLKINGYSNDVIGEQLGHSDPVSTTYYVDSLGLDRVTEINEGLVKKRTKVLPEHLSGNEVEPGD